MEARAYDFSLARVGIASTQAEIDAVADVSARFVSAGAALTVDPALHSGKIITLDALAGSVCTLPAATGTGNIYRFLTTVLATSNSHIIKVSAAGQYMSGSIVAVDNADGTATAFGTTGNGTTTQSDTITLNRSTTGSVKIGGDFITLIDAATGYWHVEGTTVCTGGEATPFSATV